MTLTEIERMLKMTPTVLRQHLEDELLIKQRKQGLIDVSCRLAEGEGFETVKAFPLSENLCVTKWDVVDIVAFKQFTGKLNIVHRGSGMRTMGVRIKKAEAFRLAENLERIMNMNFTTREQCKSVNNQDVLNAVFNLCAPYSILIPNTERRG
jgi:hypothetical protein